MKRLADISHLDVVKAVSILDQMVRGDRDGWRIDGWSDDAKRILTDALRAQGEPRKIARSLINELGRLGHIDFGELLRVTS